MHGFSAEHLNKTVPVTGIQIKDFGVIAEVVAVNPGGEDHPDEIQPAPGVKVAKISNLAKDLARSLAVLSVRVVEVIRVASRWWASKFRMMREVVVQ